ncbi:hypothetical protein [Novosphingobium sp.]|uniref:hypothetical protein n=1 Tax=Novosphingobium sp. TaxID=1874826 RepID=UPI0027358974|nr:hypothetical protein [Novosphingobium sp.]MDP3908207.1 hypothetical protein [Novosphingobium sp.]
MRLTIRKSVGKQGANRPADVAIVQDLFNRCEAATRLVAGHPPFADWAGSVFGLPDLRIANSTAPFAAVDHYTGYYAGPQLGPLPYQRTLHLLDPPRTALPVDGEISDAVIERIEAFQRDVMRTTVVDGLLSSPTGPTFKRIQANARASQTGDLFGDCDNTLSSTIDLDKLEKLFKLQITDGTQDQAAPNFRTLVQRITGDTEVTDLRWAAYMLATTKIEAMHNFWPIKETGGDAYLKRKYDVEGENPLRAKRMGNTTAGDGVKYAGRGFVQLTWKDLYKKLSKQLSLGDALVTDPDKALVYDNAYNIMSIGMRNGSFTGVGLGRFINEEKCDYFNARKIINGTDRADDVAALAEGFEVIIRLAQR